MTRELSKTNIHTFLGISKDAVESAYVKIAAELRIQLVHEEKVVIGPNGVKKFALTAKDKAMTSFTIVPAGTMIYKGCDAVPAGPPPAIILEHDKVQHPHIKEIFLASRVSPAHIAPLLCNKRRGHPVYGTPSSKWSDTVSRWQALSPEYKQEAYDFVVEEMSIFVKDGTSPVHKLIGADNKNAAKMETYTSAVMDDRGSQSMIAQMSRKHPSVLSKMASVAREGGVMCQKEIIGGLKSSLIDSQEDNIQRNIHKFAEKWGVPVEKVAGYIKECVDDYIVLDEDDNMAYDENGRPKLYCTWDFFFDVILVRCVDRDSPLVREKIDEIAYRQKNRTHKAITRIAKHLKDIPDHSTLISFLVDLIKMERENGGMSDEQVGACFSQVLLEHFKAMVLIIRSKIAENMVSDEMLVKNNFSMWEIICKSVDQAFNTFRIESMKKDEIYEVYRYAIENDNIEQKEMQGVIGNVIQESLFGNDQIVQLLLEYLDQDELGTFAKYAGVSMHDNSVMSSMLKPEKQKDVAADPAPDQDSSKKFPRLMKRWLQKNPVLV